MVTYMKFIKKHKILSSIILIIVAAVIWKIFWGNSKEVEVVTYTISQVQQGEIVNMITGSGQISNDKTQNITSKASGDITALYVKVGDVVQEGQIIARIDDSNALLDLENAKIAYEKALKDASQTKIQNAEDALQKSYEDAYSAIAGAFETIPNILEDLEVELTHNTGNLSTMRMSSLPELAKQYQKTAVDKFRLANASFKELKKVYMTTYRTSQPSEIRHLLDETYNLSKTLESSLKDAQNVATLARNTAMDRPGDEDNIKLANEVLSSVNVWVNKISSIISALYSAQTKIDNNVESLVDLKDDQPLAIKNAENTWIQKQKAYENYSIKAPFSGTISKLNVKVNDTVSNGANIGTIISSKQIAELEVNEVDIAKISLDNKVSITFDALDDLELSGRVEEVDLVGTVSQGVVSYVVKLALNEQDPRIKSGMSFSAKIITEQKSDVMIVSSSALVNNRGQYFLQVPTKEVLDDLLATRQDNEGRQNNNENRATTTEVKNGGDERIPEERMNRSVFVQTLSITNLSPEQITLVPVQIGSSDDMNTEIVSGINVGDFYISNIRNGTTNYSSGSNGSNSMRVGGGMPVNVRQNPGGGTVVTRSF